MDFYVAWNNLVRLCRPIKSNGIKLKCYWINSQPSRPNKSSQFMYLQTMDMFNISTRCQDISSLSSSIFNQTLEPFQQCIRQQLSIFLCLCMWQQNQVVFLVVFFFLDLWTFPIFARRPYVCARPNPTQSTLFSQCKINRKKYSLATL